LERLTDFLGRVPPERKVAVEFRHPSWHNDDTFGVLERFGAAYCVMSGAHLPCVLRATAPFVYVRLHGPDPNYLYGGSYSNDDLRWWAERIASGTTGRAVTYGPTSTTTETATPSATPTRSRGCWACNPEPFD
jgi:uncharacterized protein YecE (DUF72 family)